MPSRYSSGFALAIWTLSIIFMGYHQAVADTPSLKINASQQFAYAELLFQNNQYRRAAEEFERFVYFFPDDDRRREAEFQAAEAFRLAGDLAGALRLFQNLTRLYANAPPDPMAIAAYFKMAECYLQMKADSLALVQLQNVIALSEDSDIRDKAYFRMGWIAMERGDWHGAQRTFRLISDQSALPKQKILAALEETAQIPHKNPATAGWLSVIPGMGQLYLGRTQDAIVAFVVTGGSMLSSHEAFENELPTLGVMLALLGAGFYAGNIYGAISGAHKYNRLQSQQFINRLRQHSEGKGLMSRAGNTESDRWLLKLQIPF